MDKLTPLLEELSKKLGVAVDVLWAALVRQAKYDAIGYLTLDFFAVATLTLAFFLLYRLFHRKTIWELTNEDGKKGYEYNWDKQFGEIIITVIAFAVGGSLFTVGLAKLPLTIACFANPEYVALRRVLVLISSGGGH